MSTITAPTAQTLTTVPLKHRRLTSIRLLGEHRLCLHFPDGFIAELDMLSHLESRRSGMSDPLLSEQFFKQVFLDDGVLTWPNGFDLDPTAVRTWAEGGRC